MTTTVAGTGAEALGQALEAMDPDELEAFVRRLPPEDVTVVERVLADRRAVGWRADPLAMATHLEPRRYKPYPYVALLARKFRQLVNGESPRQIWVLPARYGKSAWGSQWGPAWALDRDPTTKIALTSYGDTLADENAVAVRDVLVAHAHELRVTLRRDRQARDRFVTTQGGGLLAAGVGSSLTGFGANGIVIDDPFKNWQEAHSPARRELIWNWYRAVVRLRLEEEGAWILVVTTRWHEEDLPGRLLATDVRDEGEGWDLTRLAALAEEPSTKSSDPAWLRAPDPLGRQPGEVIEARRFSLDAVLARHQAIGSYLVAGMEQGRPAPEEGGEIKRAWWQWTTSPPTRFDQAVTSWDMKLKEKQTGDYVVGQFWAATGADYWMLEQVRGQWNMPTTKAAIVLLAVRHPEAARHFVENTGNGPEVIAELRAPADGYVLSEEIRSALGMTEAEAEDVQAVMRRGLPGLIPVNPKGDKVVRARAESGVIESGHVHLLEGDPGGEYLADEAAAFPTGSHDDAVDAMSQALSKLRAGGRASVSKPTDAHIPSPAEGRSLDAAVEPPSPEPQPAGGRRRSARVFKPTGASLTGGDAALEELRRRYRP